MVIGRHHPQLLRKLVASSPVELLCRKPLSSSLRQSRPAAPLAWHFRAISTAPLRAQRVGQNYDYVPDQTNQVPPLQNAPYPQTPPPPPPPRKRRLPWRSLVTVALFLTLGRYYGLAVREFLAPEAYPEPGTPEDEAQIRVIHEKAAKEPYIQQLEAHPDWHEVTEVFPDRAENPQSFESNLLRGPLKGSRGTGGYLRTWENPKLGVFATIRYFGPATAGWPGVVHGGLLSAVLAQESGWLPAARYLGGKELCTGVEITYRRPVRANHLYLVTTQVLPKDMQQSGDSEIVRASDYKRVVPVVSQLWSVKELGDPKSLPADLLPEAKTRKPRTTVVSSWVRA